MTKEEINKLPEDLHITGTAETREVYLDGKRLDPKPSQKVYNHSPDGFNWGYGGSGPAQLALAILLNFVPKETATQLYQGLKWSTVAGWPQGKDLDQHINLREWISIELSDEAAGNVNPSN